MDISKLPAPEVIQQISYETVLAAMLADLQALDPTLTLGPSDPGYKILEVAAYREMLIRQEMNDRAKGLLLAFASGSDLDHLGATYFKTLRLVIDAGNPTAIPPVPATYESDAAYLARILLSEDSYSTAGPVEAYIYHASSADGQVKDISVTSPSAGSVVVTVLSHTGTGTADALLIAAVENALGDGVRPMTDQVTVQSASIVLYTVDATLTIYPSANAASVQAAAEASLVAWLDTQHRIGRDITVTGVAAALKIEGVHDVTLNDTLNGTDLVANLVVTDTEAAYCSGVTVVVGGSGG